MAGSVRRTRVAGGRAQVGPHVVTVRPGALDEAPGGRLRGRELWTIRRGPWVAPVPGALPFQRDPG